MRIGVLSDTHGLLRPQVLALLAGCERILHAGDVCDAAILERLATIAPVAAVRGNVDHDPPLSALPPRLAGHLDGLPFRMTHRREDVPAEWTQLARLVVFGHSHQPEITWSRDCLLLNPGACGHRRFNLPLTVAILTVAGNRLEPELLHLD